MRESKIALIRSLHIYIRVYTSEADFHKPGIYGGRVRVWANEWDVFHCTPSRGGRGRRAAVDIFRGVFFQCLVGFRVFFFRFLYFERTRPTASTRPPLASFTSLLVIIMRPFFAFRQKSRFIPGCVQGAII